MKTWYHQRDQLQTREDFHGAHFLLFLIWREKNHHDIGEVEAMVG